jgi:predicted Rossmann fold nucleotide-binding protein DprA/Smf involved in DNA uptake
LVTKDPTKGFTTAARIAVIGSRSFSNAGLVDQIMRDYLPTIQTLISGGAKGADRLGAAWARKNGIDTQIFHPDHRRYKHAFHHRNRLIVEAADLVVAFWDGHSSGTAYTIGYARSPHRCPARW